MCNNCKHNCTHRHPIDIDKQNITSSGIFLSTTTIIVITIHQPFIYHYYHFVLNGWYCRRVILLSNSSGTRNKWQHSPHQPDGSMLRTSRKHMKKYWKGPKLWWKSWLLSSRSNSLLPPENGHTLPAVVHSKGNHGAPVRHWRRRTSAAPVGIVVGKHDRLSTPGQMRWRWSAWWICMVNLWMVSSGIYLYKII